MKITVKMIRPDKSMYDYILDAQDLMVACLLAEVENPKDKAIKVTSHLKKAGNKLCFDLRIKSERRSACEFSNLT